MKHYAVVAKDLASGGRLSPSPALPLVAIWLITKYSLCLSFPISKRGLRVVLDI